jgi:hypothetical protein
VILSFLEADQPITKRYSQGQDGQLVKHPYPFVYNVTSHTHAVTTLADFHTHLVQHAAHGHTLVKGELQRPLVSESRAGSTDSELPTNWICLDLDGVEQFQTVDLFLDAIGAGGVDYILQWSSSMGVENQSGFRCHVFMLLHHDIHPQLLKQWLMHLNLSIPQLKAQLQLTKTLNALRWPLDVTTCQNDKLLYIAPPKFDAPLKDPFTTPRISLELRANRYLVLSNAIPNREALRALTHKTINELRTAQNLPKRPKTSFKFAGTTEYMANPDTAVVTEMKAERGFVYFNLNGGNSWAYYHPDDNPAFIFNFMGEPTYRTQDLLPEYWAQLQSQANTCQPNASGMIYLAFRDFASGTYYNGSYDTFGDVLKLAMAKNETQLKHFLKQHGQPVGDYIPDWELTFDPLSKTVVDPDNHILNTYAPSQYFKDTSPPKPKAGVPPTINKILLHVLGDFITRDHFLNWLAVIAQNLDRTGTAWVLHGTQGTGKGLLFHSILAPLFGEWNTTAKRMEEIEGDFTGFMKNTFLMFIDEVEAGKSLYHSKVTAKLKNLIVEPMISVREMYKPAVMVRNRINMIFASNKNAPVEVDPDDRRFNVALRQDTPLVISNAEVDAVADELTEFYRYLKHFPANITAARTPLVNASRATLIDTNRLSVDVLADNILQGNAEALWDYLPARKPVGTEWSLQRQALYERYRTLVIDIVQNGQTKLARDDLRDIFEWCVGAMPESPNKFTSLLKHHRIHMNYIWKDSRTVRGVEVQWKLPTPWHTDALKEIAANAI